MIECSNISKKYNDKYILKNFSYKFEKGLYLILGPSGVGKTTLLNILSFNDLNKEGNVGTTGGVLFLKDNKNLVNKLTVKEHFKIFEMINKRKIKKFCDLRKIINKKISKLSLGEKQIVLLTIALNSNEENIILDEPISALSQENMELFSELIEKESKNKTFIIATHNDVFKECKRIYLNKENKEKKINEINNKIILNKKKMKTSYKKIYLKKIFVKKIFFMFSLVVTCISYVGINNYLNKDFSTYLQYLKEREGMVISQNNLIKKINEDAFYQVIKKLSLYVTDYNANYYNSSLYNYDINVNGYYIDNGFILSSIKYIEKNLKENEVVLALNPKKFCETNKINYCDMNYINSLLINKQMEGFSFIISEVFENEETVIFSNEKFIKIYDYNEFEEYYFDIRVEDKESVFNIINKDDFLSCFEFTLIGENDTFNRYKVEVKNYKYFKSIAYNKYIVCLDKGYNCLDYLKPFNTLIRIDEIEDVNELSLKIVENNLNDNEIIISSKVSEILSKNKGEIVKFYFDYNSEIKTVKFYIKDVIEDNDLSIYQNSSWSFDLFKNILEYKSSDLRIKNLLIYEKIKIDDYKCDDIYNELVRKYKKVFKKIKKYLSIISLLSSLASVIVLIILEIFQNKFKQEYFNYLRILNVNIDKKEIKKGT